MRTHNLTFTCTRQSKISLYTHNSVKLLFLPTLIHTETHILQTLAVPTKKKMVHQIFIIFDTILLYFRCIFIDFIQLTKLIAIVYLILYINIFI